MLNRGKRSIALDLGKPEAIDIVRKLSTKADVIVQNFRPGVVDRLGIGYKQLAAQNDQLIYLSISGFGQTGPEAGKRAYDPIIQTYSGMAAVQGSKRGEGPEQVNQLIMDKLTAYTGSQAICAALYSRSQTNKGQHIELSMLDTAAAFLWPDAGADNILQGDDIEHLPPIGGSGQLTHFSDGWGATMMLSDSEYQGLCRAYELSELAADERFNSIDKRMQNRIAFVEILNSSVKQAAEKLTLAEAEQRLGEQHVPFAKLRQLEDLPDDPQLIHNQVFRETEHPVAGKLRETRPAPLFSHTPAQAGGPAPLVGEHTREILASIDMLDQLDNLINLQVVGI
jgi:crotonobetainyl-CoA:carnitine CoA-transferase CaiB-like acyl-CoA transferase